MMQKTNFPIEVLIHDDASTDGTADIIREYEQKYPEIIKPVYQTENQYSKGVRISQTYNYPRAQGKYIAFCEGDDYWTDPLKLQKQADFLENNPEYGMCYTKARVYSQKHKKIIKNKIRGKYFSTFEELFYKNHPVPTLTVCLRKDLLFKYLYEIKPEIRNWHGIGDVQMTIWFKKNSKIHFIDEITGVYRIVSGSACHATTYEKVIEHIEVRYRYRIFFIDFYKLPELENIVNNQRLKEYSVQAIIFKKYDEYKKIIKMVNDSTLKIKIKKLIGKSIFLMKMYHYHLMTKKLY
jgi:glycosyltransferase involved in cell wall biosynthesis